MTDHTNLIAELRYVAQWAAHHLDKAKMVNDGADALEALQDQLDIQAGSIEAVQAANQRLAAERDQLRAELRKPVLLTDWRRLEIENAQLRARLTALEGQEPVAWRFVDDEDGGHVSYSTSAPRAEHIEYLKKWNRPAWEPLFLAAGAAQQAVSNLEITQTLEQARDAMLPMKGLIIFDQAVERIRKVLAAGAAPKEQT